MANYIGEALDFLVGFRQRFCAIFDTVFEFVGQCLQRIAGSLELARIVGDNIIRQGREADEQQRPKTGCEREPVRGRGQILEPAAHSIVGPSGDGFEIITKNGHVLEASVVGNDPHRLVPFSGFGQRYRMRHLGKFFFRDRHNHGHAARVVWILHVYFQLVQILFRFCDAPIIRLKIDFFTRQQKTALARFGIEQANFGLSGRNSYLPLLGNHGGLRFRLRRQLEGRHDEHEQKQRAGGEEQHRRLERIQSERLGRHACFSGVDRFAVIEYTIMFDLRIK